ncbi:mechanosensitive ion channel family protein [Gemmobacter denitrificans]|uniref:Mechanosensitive ion channel family protein n=1 Tax=Gemmobacter denitrificans TaxID=3123040 RepID=A0ABU8BTR0_9RHOB
MMRAICLWLAVLTLGAAAYAQTPPPQEKLDALAELLADPDLRAWIDAQAKAPLVPVETLPPTTEPQSSVLAARLDSMEAYFEDTLEAIPTLPAQASRARTIFMQEVNARRPIVVIGLVAAFVAVGLILDRALHLMTARYRRWMIAQSPFTPYGRVRALAGRIFYAILKLAVFVLGSIGLFLSFEWPPLLREIVLALLAAALAARLAVLVGRVLLVPPSMNLPHAAEYRILPISDEMAQHWYRWGTILTGLVAAFFAIMAVAGYLGFDAAGQRAILIPTKMICLVAALAAVWRRPNAGTGTGHTVSWLLAAYFVLLFILDEIGARLMFWLAVAAVCLPALIWVANRAVIHVLRAPQRPQAQAEPDSEGGSSEDMPSETVIAAGAQDRPVPPVIVAVVDRGIRVVLIALAVLLLGRVAGITLDSIDARETMADRLIAGSANALIIILAADFGWSVIKAIIAHKLGQIEGESAGSAPGHAVAADHARSRTLLPILQNILFATVVVVTVLMVLSSLGVEIAPLIAGAGVVGVAIGFGAQTLVKDVIAGIFYLFDDAFRVGHYITSASHMGTVESFSLRSVKLRHHRGYLTVVPFSELGAIQNLTTEFVIDKFNITVDYATDLEEARKIIKKIGQELAQNPEFAPNIYEPLKLQGVQAFGEYGIELRLKMVTKPGEQFVIRRRAYLNIAKAFAEKGIKIPFPTVHVQDGNASAAAAKLMAERKAAAEAAAATQG